MKILETPERRPLVSILIPAYNAERWVGDTIDSALRQTWPHKEIIVVDDGSSDRTRLIANKYSKAGVLVVSQPNQGASTARNKAFSLCHGDYIQWLDADDAIAPDKIELQMAVAEKEQNKRLLLSSQWGRFLFRIKRADFMATDLWQDLSPVEWLLRKMSQNIWMQPGNWLVSRELTKAAGPWDERLSFDDDGEYFCRILLQSEGVKFVPEAKAFYRVTGPESLSSVNSKKKIESAWLSIRLHIYYLKQLEDSDRTRQSSLTFLQTWLPLFESRPDIVQEVHQLALDLGGPLGALKRGEPLRWKFSWMQNFLGRRAAYWAQTRLPQLKHSTIRCWDKTMFHLEKLSS